MYSIHRKVRNLKDLVEEDKIIKQLLESVKRTARAKEKLKKSFEKQRSFTPRIVKKFSRS